jgi:hypothetical protein
MVLTSASGQFSVGAFADSAHEYLLKQWLPSGQSETKTRDLCTSISGHIDYPSDVKSANAVI